MSTPNPKDFRQRIARIIEGMLTYERSMPDWPKHKSEALDSIIAEVIKLVGENEPTGLSKLTQIQAEKNRVRNQLRAELRSRIEGGMSSWQEVKNEVLDEVHLARWWYRRSLWYRIRFHWWAFKAKGWGFWRGK